MPSRSSQPKAALSDYKAIAAQYAKAKRLKELEDAKNNQRSLPTEPAPSGIAEKQRQALEARRKATFEKRFQWTVGFWVWMLCIHVISIFLFTSGFLLTRLVLDERSNCANPPIQPLLSWKGQGSVDGGCWHPKTFDKAVVVLIDALRYDFTVPVEDESKAEGFHNAFPFLYESSVKSPNNAFLLPFIADPPTATLQRLKGLTTGTLPTFVDVGSSFGGTAIDEDNLLLQLRGLGKRIVHLGDDTWTALFPGYFQPNISRAYDSFNVWDLHTVDNGVLEHIFPLMKPEKQGEWDFLIGHLLGVDHAGHRYGPNHAAMTAKLVQMDQFIRNLTETIDDNTLLVVMGDHGMDGKGDHGGESDDEVEAALWMYSKRPLFGRTKPEFVTPPATAKVRPVNQIDLVPTLALLLGLPIPYNNLGRPIEEAFAGKKGNAWGNLAAVARMASAGIRKYQASYFAARGMVQSAKPGSAADLWEIAGAASEGRPVQQAVYHAYTTYQEETLRVCKDLWARFDIPKMILGITAMALGVIVLIVYVSRDEDDDYAVLDNAELDLAEKNLELLDGSSVPEAASYQGLSKIVVKSGLLGGLIGAALGIAYVSFTNSEDWPMAVAAAALVSLVAVTITLSGAGKNLVNVVPNTVWGWLSVVFTLSQSIGFASNSYTIWEDSISLFFLSTFGFTNAVAALRRPTIAERTLGVYHSILFLALGRLASFSKLCREEQMPYCTSTYYASANSSTSASWQLVIPFVVFLILPSIIKAYMMTSRSYEGLAPAWIGYVFRMGLLLSAAYWALDAADNGDWITWLPAQTLKTIQVSVAQLVLALAFVAGTTAFIWAPPCVSILTKAASNARTAQITVLGYGNVNGARYLLLVLNFAGACILLSKPMGSGAMAIMLWQVLSLVEIVDLNALTAETIGPVTLALLGNFHFFKTGHQAAFSSIQWDSAFIPLFTIRYPWSPIVVILNTFAGQILACVAVPLVVIWKTNPKRKGVLESVTRALGVFVAFYATQSLATMAWAGWLRRHLMLFRVFSPRFMVAAAVLLIVDLVGILATLTGVRTNALAISEVFGWAD
ncbi:GPI ethanolamine phosphate transferase [Pseudomassariella vexata]|uniref:GPI ethanolamine phosphate transferase n=1 Tax=Pseudomassariella vexata TaxID=1141098 RepID=A0A1Y2EFL2_9PEZI|nr:GPI ethanolamine phosphate transferase [Pseudomassariella vexata]ORY70094.1 GPI ethanolamine phosphate transferase [Pseudomassariella vexata]